ncbi:GntR family transcriptional regulator [Paenibacillus sp. GCM10027626]|uniref:GntR family transcriptional regulator n=1 Tax=Paenibacillus sp. GCM10027626 TaxID=3273411 RepID=UPI00363582D5
MKLTRNRGALYLQVKNILKDRILHGLYPLHSNFPSEPELADEFNVSRITVRNAIKELVQEGFLETKSGKRTKIIRNEVISGRIKGKRFTELLEERGHKIRTEWIKAALEQNGKTTENYRLFGEQCVRLERIYYLDEVPYIHFTHFLTPEMSEVGIEELNFHSLYELIKEQDIMLMKFQDQFAVEIAPSEIAALLKVKEGTPLLKRLRFSYDENGDLIEYSIGYYNTEIMHYHVDYI